MDRSIDGRTHSRTDLWGDGPVDGLTHRDRLNVLNRGREPFRNWRRKGPIGPKGVGTALALYGGMAIYTSTPTNEVQEVQWLHWLFVREGHMLSCDVDVRGDGQ